MVGAVQHLIARCLFRILAEQLLHCGRGERSWLGTPSTASFELCSIHTGCVMFLPVTNECVTICDICDQNVTKCVSLNELKAG